MTIHSIKVWAPPLYYRVIYTGGTVDQERPGPSPKIVHLRLRGARRPQRIQSEGHTGRLIQTRSRAGVQLRSLYLHPTRNTRPMESSAKRGHVPVEPVPPRCPRTRKVWLVPSSTDAKCNLQCGALTYQKVGIRCRVRATMTEDTQDSNSWPHLEPFPLRTAPANRSEVLATTREPAYLLPSTCLPGLRYHLPSEMRDRIETSNAAESHGSAATSTTARAILKGPRRTANLPFHLIGYQC